MFADKKRSRTEWHAAIEAIITNNGGKTDMNTLYAEIPNALTLNERELRPSTEKARLEPVWRGTLRGYLSDMVHDKTLYKAGFGARDMPSWMEHWGK
jgi:hypothetical protein